MVAAAMPSINSSRSYTRDLRISLALFTFSIASFRFSTVIFLPLVSIVFSLFTLRQSASEPQFEPFVHPPSHLIIYVDSLSLRRKSFKRKLSLGHTLVQRGAVPAYHTAATVVRPLP